MVAVGCLVDEVVGVGVCSVELAIFEVCLAELTGVEGCLTVLAGVEGCLAGLVGVEICFAGVEVGLAELAGVEGGLAGVEGFVTVSEGVDICLAELVGVGVCLFSEFELIDVCLVEFDEEVGVCCLPGVVELCFIELAEEFKTAGVEADVFCLDRLEGVDEGVCFVDEAGVEGCLLLLLVVLLLRGVDVFLVDDELDRVEFCRVVVVFELVVVEEEV